MNTTPDELIASWRAASLSGDWRVSGDWDCPAVSDVAHAVITGTDPLPSVAVLARRRAHDGVGIAEGLSDLFALCDTLRAEGCDYSVEERRNLILAFSSAWAEDIQGRLPAISCVDAVTGLSTRAHFSKRVHELYDDLRSTPHTDWVLVSATVKFPPTSREETQCLEALLTSRARALLTPLGAFMSLENGVFAAVVPNEEFACSRAQGLYTWIAERGGDCQLTVDPLPEHGHEVGRFLHTRVYTARENTDRA